jgi:gliding motility-associated-like protein
LPAELTVTLGETLVLEAQTNLTAWQSLVWTPQPDTSCIACLRQEWIPSVSQVYEVAITDTLGCSASASVRVIVRKQVDIYIPNVFSPNLDGINDFWTLDAGLSVVSLNSLQIFDRWGDMVYFWDAPIPVDEWPGWDGVARGEKVNPGVFVYYLEVTLANGETVLKKGDLTVLR